MSSRPSLPLRLLLPLLLLMAFAQFFVSAAPAARFTPGGGGGGSISGLFNTGMDSSGNPLADGSADSHYTLVSAPNEAGNSATVTLQHWPVVSGIWMPDTNASKWVSPHADELTNLEAPDDYTYQTTFTVTGDPSAVQINGRLAQDTVLTSILLNGQIVAWNVSNTFANWTSFTLNNGFISGSNTLQFVVTRTGSSNNPSGFCCEMIGTSSTPPAGTIGGLFSTGLTAAVIPQQTLARRYTTL